MKLTSGRVAPDFEAEDIFGNPVSPKSFAGKLLLLSFFRNGACAICNLQVHRLIQHYPDFHKRGLEIVAVFESPRESVLANVSKQDAPFPIIADPTAELYDLYGVESSLEKVMASVDGDLQKKLVRDAEAIGYKLTHEEGSNFFRLPADFLIGPNKLIQQAFYSEMVGQHLPFEQISHALDQLAAPLA